MRYRRRDKEPRPENAEGRSQGVEDGVGGRGERRRCVALCVVPGGRRGDGEQDGCSHRDRRVRFVLFVGVTAVATTAKPTISIFFLQM